MATLGMTSGFAITHPGWLSALVLLIPVIGLGWRSLGALSPLRRRLAIGLRCLGILLLVLLLARLTRTQQSDEVTVVAVLDRSQSIPTDLQQQALDYIAQACPKPLQNQRLAIVDVAERATIARLPSTDPNIPRRNTTLNGEQTHLARGVQLALAIAPPDSGVRLCLISEGNQTIGDVRSAARIAAANHIPIDVLPLRYHHEREVVFRHLAAPAQARSGETVPLRLVLESTQRTRGQIQLHLNGRPVDLNPDSAQLGSPVTLQAGTNVKTLSVPLGSRGAHVFEAVFIPDIAQEDQVMANNRASALTLVAGPGHILVVMDQEVVASHLVKAVQDTGLELRTIPGAELPNSLNHLIDVDAVVLADVDASQLTFQQMEMLHRYVTELGGGLVMIGGPQSFGAGGWIGSPVADILPVDLDPPQKKQLPKGALVLVMHACEMPQGNYWGKQVALAATKALSRQDLLGILAFNWQGGDNWVYPLAEVGDKKKAAQAIQQMQMGDMPDLGSHLQQAYDALMATDAAQRHIIVISDGDPQGPTRALLDKMKEAKITCSGVGIFPHSQNDIDSLLRIAQVTGGRFYSSMNPAELPQIFVKEAQVVKRSLIVEETFTPQVTYGLSEIIQGLGPLPNLDGYVITTPKGGLSHVVLSSAQDDPILATTQAGLGRCVAFTSSADSRWAGSWLQWPGNSRFWEQVLRWAAKPDHPRDCELVVDVQGRTVDIHVETVDPQGTFVPLVGLNAQAISPDMEVTGVDLRQIGPGQYRGQFIAQGTGNYLVNLRYRRSGSSAKTGQVQASVTIPYAPEFSDLSDNVALLTEVSTLSGGRVLDANPATSQLFSREGITFPRAQQPLTLPLLWMWLGVFLLDVAVRRVSLDLAAIRRRWNTWRTARRTGFDSDPMLKQLQRTREQVQKQRTGPGQRPSATQRFEGPTKEAEEAEDLSVATSSVPSKPPSDEKTEPTPKEQEGMPESHIDQLLKAKRKKKDA